MIVTIGNISWQVILASAYIDIARGLSNIDNIPEYTGMLFDLGYDHSRIDINMSEMLFNLDIIFINSSFGVVGVLHDVQPHEEAAFIASGSLGARYFLEVNAGEAASINVGDLVVLEDGLDNNIVDTIFSYVVFGLVMVAMLYIAGRMLKPYVEPIVKALREPKDNNPSSNPSNRYHKVQEYISGVKKDIRNKQSLFQSTALLDVELNQCLLHDCLSYEEYSQMTRVIGQIQKHGDNEEWKSASSRLGDLEKSINQAFSRRRLR